MDSAPVIKRNHRPHFGKWFANDVLKAIRKYRHDRAGEKICVALSGGKDSTSLLYILDYLGATRRSRSTSLPPM